MIGVDFDNTIVCYDALFHRVALERGLIPRELPAHKSAVRDHLRRAGREDAWTEMQGDVYGARMAEAAPYPGVVEFFQACRRAGIPTRIISHKTRHPFRGEPHDLHQAALRWLEQQGFFDPQKIGLSRGDVFLELTKQAKLERIAECGCAYFIDDLPEVLSEPAFPKIERILFDPNHLHPSATNFFRAQSWPQIWDRIQNAPASREVAPGLLEFLGPHGFGAAAALTPLAGGGNNRVFRVHDAGRTAVLKQYFRHGADTRDRFAAERAFYDYLWPRGIRRTPEPLAWDDTQKLGLFSFVEGRKLQADEVNHNSVEQALEFVLELNRKKTSASAAVPAASEACFSDAQHLACFDQRVARLEQIEETADIDREARDFIAESLQPAWREIRSAVCPDASALDKPLPQEQRVLSPSDFGFHNALRDETGRLRFLDFEYAGWDDPAKLICDFFCQPQAPVPLTFWEQVAGALIRGLRLEAALAARARRLLPAYQIKWCCIILNDFAGGHQARRDFAQGAATAARRKTAQLNQARRALRAACQTLKKN